MYCDVCLQWCKYVNYKVKCTVLVCDIQTADVCFLKDNVIIYTILIWRVLAFAVDFFCCMPYNGGRTIPEVKTMLMIQLITKQYDKRSRSGEAMRRLRSIRFERIPALPAGEGEFFLHDNRFRRARFLSETERCRVSERVFAERAGDAYRVLYSRHPADQHFRQILTLLPGEYGRVIYNERAVTFDGEWYYIRTTVNFVHAESAQLRENIFCRKEPDQLFEDMAYLRYCGDYHKA